jgi:hypothetical protein
MTPVCRTIIAAFSKKEGASIMAKNNVVREDEFIDDDDDFEMSDFFGDASDDSGFEADFLASIMAANASQAQTALELTRLALQHSKATSADQVFATFKKAANVINDSFPMQATLQKALAGQS